MSERYCILCVDDDVSGLEEALFALTHWQRDGRGKAL
jgi:hypothetical protein